MNNLRNFFKFLLYSMLCGFFFTTAIAKSSDWSVSETSKLRLISPYAQNNTKNFIVGLEYQMEPGWKTYWKSPGDGGFAQTISWENSSNVKNVNILWPTPVEFEILGLTSLGYENNVIFPLEVEIEDELQRAWISSQMLNTYPKEEDDPCLFLLVAVLAVLPLPHPARPEQGRQQLRRPGLQHMFDRGRP